MTEATRRADALTAAPAPDWASIRAKLARQGVEKGIPPADPDETLAELQREWAITGRVAHWAVPDAGAGPAECEPSYPWYDDPDRLW